METAKGCRKQKPIVEYGPVVIIVAIIVTKGGLSRAHDWWNPPGGIRLFHLWCRKHGASDMQRGDDTSCWNPAISCLVP